MDSISGERQQDLWGLGDCIIGGSRCMRCMLALSAIFALPRVREILYHYFKAWALWWLRSFDYYNLDSVSRKREDSGIVDTVQVGVGA